MLKTISQRQVAIEEEIIVSMKDIVEKTTFTILNKNITESILTEVADLQIGVNQFVPQGKPLDLTIVYTNFNEGDVIANIEISDGDGDDVIASFISGNNDKDGDTNKPFGINASHALFISDMDDIKQLAGQEVALNLELDDRGDDLGPHGELIVK